MKRAYDQVAASVHHVSRSAKEESMTEQHTTDPVDFICCLSFGSALFKVDPINAVRLGHFRALQEEKPMSVVYTLGTPASSADTMTIVQVLTASMSAADLLDFLTGAPTVQRRYV